MTAHEAFLNWSLPYVAGGLIAIAALIGAVAVLVSAASRNSGSD